MISANFENLILQGKADAKTLNINSGIFNYNIGKSKSLLVENIHCHNYQDNVFTCFTEDTAVSAMSYNVFITINIYSDNDQKNITIKNVWNVSSGVMTDGSDRFYFSLNSNLNFNKDVFWLFNGENLIVEITTMLDAARNPTFDNTPYLLNSKINENPLGFTLPNPLFIQYNNSIAFNTKQMGRQTPQRLPNTEPTMDGLIIPRFGDGLTGNILNPITTDGLPFSQPLVNLGIIELEIN